MEPSTAKENAGPNQNDELKPDHRPRRWLRILKRVVISLVIILIILVYGVFPYWFAVQVTNARTRSSDLRFTETPADYGAQFRDVQFTTSDGVRISGWLMPSGDKHATIIFSHGLFRSRRELLERAARLWQLGYGALVYDSRNHGASGPARVSLGYNERLDAEAAVRFLREEIDSSDRIVLFGISMGATAALLAAAETEEVAAVISDSSFLTFEDTAAHHVRLFLHLPAFPMANLVRFYVCQRADFDGSKLNALDAVRRLGERPAMFIAAAHDARMPPEIARKLYEASASHKRDLLIVDGPESDIHGHAFQSDKETYINRVAQFLESALQE
ncbi:MAG TPA: alpha/beta hydrolase [Blastocatellia bacterium]|nr:alpha/beta hydrolase [Blastocatellia bacterium]